MKKLIKILAIFVILVIIVIIVVTLAKKNDKIVICIDAGHGGTKWVQKLNGIAIIYWYIKE